MPQEPSTETRSVAPGHYTAPGGFWQDHRRPDGSLSVRCAHCKCWFGLHGDRAISACRGGCHYCPGFEPGEATAYAPRQEESAA